MRVVRSWSTSRGVCGVRCVIGLGDSRFARWFCAGTCRCCVRARAKRGIETDGSRTCLRGWIQWGESLANRLETTSNLRFLSLHRSRFFPDENLPFFLIIVSSVSVKNAMSEQLNMPFRLFRLGLLADSHLDCC